MHIHPRIKKFIDLLKWAGINEHEIKKTDSLRILMEKGSTSTEAMVVIHQGFKISDVEAEKIVKESKLWAPEDIEDIAYQTFLYMNYNPDDPNFHYDENSIKFSLIAPPKKPNEPE